MPLWVKPSRGTLRSLLRVHYQKIYKASQSMKSFGLPNEKIKHKAYQFQCASVKKEQWQNGHNVKYYI